MMDVYLVPVGADRYELYCETPHDRGGGLEEQPTGVVRRLVARFHAVLDHVEREHHRPPPAGAASRGAMGRLVDRGRRRVTCWLAEKVAEQRVLWQLRRASEAVALFPDDLDEQTAEVVLRRRLQRDATRHTRWLVVDAVGFVLSGALMPIPGPNLLAYYFAFRVVGHYLAWRGARNGAHRVRWTLRPSSPLAELRHAWRLGPAERNRHVHQVASALRLEHLARFFERTGVPTP